MTTGDALLKAILDNPKDDNVRLVYADWLGENGQEARAELIRVQVELVGRRGGQCDCHGEFGPMGPSCTRRAELEAREDFLLTDPDLPLWLGAFAGLEPVGPLDDPRGKHWHGAWIGGGEDGGDEFPVVCCDFSRGFPAHFQADWDSWRELSGELRARFPVETVTLLTRPTGTVHWATDFDANRWTIGDYPGIEFELSPIPESFYAAPPA
jgi:uncharacterized protein (TIGR02996 family)